MAAERRIVASVTVPVAQERLWELVCETSRYAEWVENTVEVVRTDGPAELGSTYDERNRILGPLTGSSRWEVVEHEPPRRSVHRGEGIVLASAMSVEFELQALGEDSTEVTMTYRYEPAFGPLGSLLASGGMHRLLEGNFRRSVGRLAEIASREHQAGTPA